MNFINDCIDYCIDRVIFNNPEGAVKGLDKVAKNESRDQFEEDTITMLFNSIESDITRYTELDFALKLSNRFNVNDVCINAKKNLKEYSDTRGENSFVKEANIRIKELDQKWFDVKYKFPGEVWMKIFQNSGVKEIGRLSSVSKTFEIATKDNCVWQRKCIAEDPTLQNPDSSLWKIIYKNEIHDGLKKFLGDCNYQFTGTGGYHSLNVNVNHPELTCRHFKKLIVKQEKLKCSPDSILLWNGVYKLEDNSLIKELDLPRRGPRGIYIELPKDCS